MSTEKTEGKLTKAQQAALVESELAVNETVVLCNTKEAHNNVAAAALANTQAKLVDVEYQRALLKDSFDEGQDYRHGYIPFNMDINPESVQGLAHMLRRLDRMYPGLPFVIELNSPGGNIIEGFQLIDEIRRISKLGHHITIRVRGEAASMAAVILQAADKREVGPSAFIMLHRAAFAAKGKTHDVEDQVEFTKVLEARIYKVLAERSGKDPSVFEKLMANRKDIWLSAQEAVDLGLADEVV